MLTDHTIDERLEFLVDLVDVVEFPKSPAAELSEIVDARHPLSAHGFRFEPHVLTSVALHLDDKVKRIIGPTAIINLNNEIGNVDAGRRTVLVGNFESEPLVLHIVQK